jgi:AhpD family alkylhydroperoxidase
LTVATVENCPYCIDAYTNKCLSIGVSEEEMMEAIHVGASMLAGIALAHSTQMRKIIKKKQM